VTQLCLDLQQQSCHFLAGNLATAAVNSVQNRASVSYDGTAAVKVFAANSEAIMNSKKRASARFQHGPKIGQVLGLLMADSGFGVAGAWPRFGFASSIPAGLIPPLAIDPRRLGGEGADTDSLQYQHLYPRGRCQESITGLDRFRP
jgi:hypothetical protein